MRAANIFVPAFLFALLIGFIVPSHEIAPLLTSEYSPSRALYMAHPVLLWTIVGAEASIVLSYLLFFLGISLLLRRLDHIAEMKPYLWLFATCRIFITASGAVVVMRVAELWFPLHQFSLGLKLVCAAASMPAAILFAWQAPKMAGKIQSFFRLVETEHQQSEALRKSEAFLDRTGRMAGIGGWEIDLRQGDKVTWSDELYHILGIPVGHQPTLLEGLNLYTPESRPIIAGAIERACATGQGWDLELGIFRRDGRKIFARVMGEVEFEDGKPIRIAGAFQDKTVQIGIRHALSEANERIILATDSAGIGIWDWKIDEDKFICDAWIHRLHGVEPGEEPMPLEFWKKNLHDQDRDRILQALRDAIESDKPYNTEFRVVWKDGSIHHLRATGKVTRDNSGHAICMVGANWDVTEARRLTAQLAAQHELLRVTLQSIGEGVITKDASRNITWMNAVAERLTGWSAAEAIGRPVTEIFKAVNEATRLAEDSHLALFPLGDKAVSSTEPTLLIARGGSECVIESTASPLRNAHQDLLGSVLVFRDITEQRRLAAETERNVKLQFDLKLKDEFLSHVSHELRSPLTSIYSFTSIIADDLAGATTLEQQEYLQIVLKNVVQLQSMIEDLLTVTQSKEGKLIIDLQSVSVAAAIEDAMNTIQSAAAVKRIEFSATESTQLSPVCADPTRLRQVLIILLDNAVKFTPQGGSVTVQTSQTEAGLLLVQITDTGCGIVPEDRVRIFEKLFQVTGPNHADTSHAGRTGLGLGLHIARKLVTLQGGSIWVTGAANEGSTFNFSLPVFIEGCVSTATAGETVAHGQRSGPSLMAAAA